MMNHIFSDRVTNHYTDQTKKTKGKCEIKLQKPGLMKHFSVSRACRAMIMPVQILLLKYFGELHFFRLSWLYF